jgi:hypothetical protein
VGLSVSNNGHASGSPAKNIHTIPRRISTNAPTPPSSTNQSIPSSPSPLILPVTEKILQSCLQLPSPVSTPDLAALHEQLNQEQRELFCDPRVAKQLEWFNRVRGSKPSTHYSELAPIGIHIIEAGTPAQTNPDISRADYLFGNSRELEKWLTGPDGTGDKLFVLRDTDWFHTRSETSGSTALEKFRATSGEGLHIEVQLLEKTYVEGENSVTSMPIEEIIERFADKSQTRPPINLLSLRGQDEGTVPWPLSKHCNLLNQAAAFSASSAQTGFVATAGKQSTEVVSRYVDLQSCIHFQIFGQAGAISSWHIDSIGPYTWVSLTLSEQDCTKQRSSSK